MRYRFYLYSYTDDRTHKEISMPCFAIEESDPENFEFLSVFMEYNQQELELVRDHLNAVIDGKQDEYLFGFDIYELTARKEKTEAYFNYINQGGPKLIATIPTQDLYEFAKDFCEYYTTHKNN